MDDLTVRDADGPYDVWKPQYRWLGQPVRSPSDGGVPARFLGVVGDARLKSMRAVYSMN